MKQIILPLLQIGVFTCAYLSATSDIILAQVTSDNTVNTKVNQNGSVAEITGGTTRDSNLFHSFQEFSVRTGNEAFFNNADSIANIFSRVTGGKLSNIDGLIRANGSASLFLINPAGIIFGENARLDVGGSFYGSSASSILFEDGEFSAADLDNPPLLTINAPVGLNFRDNPGQIINQSLANDVGLQVSAGETLALIGGDIKLAGGLITAPGGLVELGGLSAAGEIGISETGSFNFPEAVARSNVELTKNAAVDVRAAGGGFINVNTQNLLVADTSELLAGIGENMGSPNAQAGDITIDATDSITVVGDNLEDPNDPDQTEELDTGIRNFVGLPVTRRDNSSEDSSAVGNSGSIFVNTERLQISNKGAISAKVYGEGNSGDVNVTAQTITLDAGGIFSQIRPGGKGDSGDINLDVDSLSVKDASFAITDNKGGGEAGDININATDSVYVGGEIFNALISELGEGVTGSAGDINIDTLSLTVDGTVGGAQLLTTSKGKGDAGNININATDTISLLGGGGIISQVDVDAEGNGGNINIATKSLDIQGNFNPDNLTDGNFVIQASSQGLGDGGDITIQVSDRAFLNNASILSQVLEQGTGNAGTIVFNSPIIAVDDYSLIANGIIGKGNGGNVKIDSDTLSIENFSILASNARNNAMGNGGNIEIDSNEITIAEGGVISAFTENNSNGGKIAINANNLTLLSGGKIVTQTDGGGNAGDTTLNIAEGITIDGSNPARSGELTPFEDNLLIELEPATGLFANASVNSAGNSGNITIVTPNSLNLTDGAEISVDSRGAGNSGTLSIQANDLNLDNGFISAATVSGTGGLLSLDVDGNINLRNSSKISAEALGDADGGNIDIDANFIVAFPNGNSDIIANAQRGQGGRININAKSILGIAESPFLNDLTNDINASSDFGLDGTVFITTPEVDALQGATELPTNIVVPEQTTAQACQANRESQVVNNFIINGKGGMPVLPDMPLNSDIITIDNNLAHSDTEKSNQIATSTIKPIQLGDKKITPARGVVKTADGRVILTAYAINERTNRIHQGSINCNSVQPSAR